MLVWITLHQKGGNFDRWKSHQVKVKMLWIDAALCQLCCHGSKLIHASVLGPKSEIEHAMHATLALPYYVLDLSGSSRYPCKYSVHGNVLASVLVMNAVMKHFMAHLLQCAVCKTHVLLA